MPVPVSLCSTRMTIEVRHLRCFLAVADERNVTRAAVRLHLSQPALSRTLSQLEQRLGVRLVDRSTHHLQLTDAGDRFREEARQAVDAFDRCVESVDATVPPLRFGHGWSSGGHTASIVRAWHEAFPDRVLQVRSSDVRLAGLATGDVDIAILRGRVAGRRYRTASLGREARVAVIPTSHPLADRASVTLADLSTEPLVINSVAGLTRPELWPVGRRPTVVADTSTTEDWLVSIAAGVGVGVTASSTALMHPHPTVRYVPLTDAEPVPVLLAWPAADPHPHVPALVRLAQNLRR